MAAVPVGCPCRPDTGIPSALSGRWRAPSHSAAALVTQASASDLFRAARRIASSASYQFPETAKARKDAYIEPARTRPFPPILRPRCCRIARVSLLDSTSQVMCPSCSGPTRRGEFDSKRWVLRSAKRMALDDHFTNRWAAAIGLDKTGRLRQAGKSSRSRGKDVHHAKPLCASDCLELRSPKPLADADPSPFHSASSGLPLSADPAVGRQGSAVQSPSCQRIRLHAQYRRSLAHTLS